MHTLFVLIHVLLFITSIHMYANCSNPTLSKNNKFILQLIQEEKKVLSNHHFAYPNRIIFSYVIKKINGKSAPRNIVDGSYTPYFDDDKAMYPYYNRLINPDFYVPIDSIKKYIKHNIDFDRAIMWAIYADKIPDSTEIDYINTLLHRYTDTNANVRGTAHAALVIKLLKDHQLIHYIKEYKNLEQSYIQTCIRYLNIKKCYTDDGMEAILTFILLDRIDLIQQKWIDEIISHQQADGGWKWDESRIETHQHPTLLAYWILSAWEKRILNYNPNWFTTN